MLYQGCKAGLVPLSPAPQCCRCPGTASPVTSQSLGQPPCAACPQPWALPAPRWEQFVGTHLVLSICVKTPVTEEPIRKTRGITLEDFWILLIHTIPDTGNVNSPCSAVSPLKAERL